MSKGLRVVAGQFGGRRLAASPRSRPTQEQVREALFSRWQPRVRGGALLDLYCGSGLIGIEALSRGAKEVVLVDERIETAQANATLLGLKAPELSLVGGKLPGLLKRWPGKRPVRDRFGLVFADPPYDIKDFHALLVGASERLTAGGELALEHSTRKEPPAALGSSDTSGSHRNLFLERHEVKTYGESALSFYRLTSVAIF